jgi:hypothetical protein
MTVDARVLNVLKGLFGSAGFWVALVGVVLASIFVAEILNPVPTMAVNDALWIVTNLALFAGYIALLFYVVVYGIVFEWRYLPGTDSRNRLLPNTGGRLIFQLTASELGLVVLIVTQLFFFPTTGRPWYIPPVDPVIWLPTVRFVVYGAVVVAIFRLAAQLIRNIVNSEPVQIMVTPRASRPAAEPGNGPARPADAPGPVETTAAPPAGD